MKYSVYQKYKNSGVSWLGEVPDRWSVQTIKFLCSIHKGVNVKKDPTVLSVTLNGIKVKDIESGEGQLAASYDNYNPVTPNHIVLNPMDLISGFVGKPPMNGVVSPAYTSMTVSKKCNIDYYVYLFQKFYFEKILFPYGKGVSYDFRWTINNETFFNLPTLLPSLQEQQSIVKYLNKATDKIDNLISKQKKLIELLKEKRQSVISHAVTKGLDPNMPMKDSGVEWLGEIPEHWEVKRLKFIIKNIQSGTSVNAADQPATSIDFGVLKTSCVYSGKFQYIENKTVMESEKNRVSCPLKINTLIVSRMNTPDLVGAAGVVKNAPNNIFLPDRLWQVYFINSNPSFVHFLTLTSIYRGYIKTVCAGTSSSMQNLSQDDFRNFIFFIPNIEEQNSISKYLDQQTSKIDDLIGRSTRSIDLLKEKRIALIAAVVTGKIDVREAA